MHFRPLYVIPHHFGNQPDPILFGAANLAATAIISGVPLTPVSSRIGCQISPVFDWLYILTDLHSVTLMTFDHHLQYLIIEACARDLQNLSICFVPFMSPTLS